MSKKKQITIGFYGSFLSLLLISIFGFRESLKHTSRGGHPGDIGDRLFVITIFLIFLISVVLPLGLWIEGFKNYAKGMLQGIIVYYILAAIIVRLLIYR